MFMDSSVPFLIGILFVVWEISISVWIVLERRSPTATLAWIFGLALLPYVGILVYIVFGPRRLQRKHLRRALAREAVQHWSEGAQYWEAVSSRLQDPRHRSIVEAGRRSGEAPATSTRSVQLFFDGDTCFEALLRAVEAARHHVHLEYYIFNPDTLGQRLSQALQKKAREGVQVRLLMDGFGSARMRRRYRKPLLDAGVEVAFFNSMRFARFKPGLANFRTHRKIVVVDGHTALTGGMNIMDEHSRAIHGDDAWRDSHLLIRGTATIALQLLFMEDWHYATGSLPFDPALVPRPGRPGEGPLTHIVGSGPDNDAFAVHRVLFAAIGQARERVLATTPYLVPDEAILAALTGAALRGVDVQLLVPRRADSFLVDAAAKSYYANLLRAGVRIFEYQPSMIHAKTMVIDDDISIVGTANLDNRSFRLNFEVIAVLFDSDHAKTLSEQFTHDLSRSKEVIRGPDTKLPLGRQVVEGVARLFSPIL